MYNSGRFLTVTGYLMPGTRGTVEHRQDALEELRLRVFGPSTPPSKPRDYRATGRVESAQIESALSYIQADDRENWLIVGMALHSSLGAAGRSIWDSWYRTSAKYDMADQGRTRPIFRPDGGGKLSDHCSGWPAAPAGRAVRNAAVCGLWWTMRRE